jgi:hypothetical protein
MTHSDKYHSWVFKNQLEKQIESIIGMEIVKPASKSKIQPFEKNSKSSKNIKSPKNKKSEKSSKK